VEIEGCRGVHELSFGGPKEGRCIQKLRCGEDPQLCYLILADWATCTDRHYFLLELKAENMCFIFCPYIDTQPSGLE